jgi:hypothetical protein
MRTDNLRDIVKILMESRCYFDLNLRERFALVVHVLKIMDNNPVLVSMRK